MRAAKTARIFLIGNCAGRGTQPLRRGNLSDDFSISIVAFREKLYYNGINAKQVGGKYHEKRN